RVDPVDELGALLEEPRARIGERHRACRAVEQRRLDEGLELLDAARDHRGRHPQLPRRVAEALGFRDLHERLYAQESIHDAYPGSSRDWRLSATAVFAIRE